MSGEISISSLQRMRTRCGVLPHVADFFFFSGAGFLGASAADV